jgi:anti-sigma B factor antagonist
MAADRLNQPIALRNYVGGTELFSVIVHQPNPTELFCHVAGEIDLLAEPPLQAHLNTLLANRPERLIIDLSQVSFMGATGLSVLIRARHTAVQQGTTLKLSNPSRHAARPLELMGFHRLFEMVPPVTEQY